MVGCEGIALLQYGTSPERIAQKLSAMMGLKIGKEYLACYENRQKEKKEALEAFYKTPLETTGIIADSGVIDIKEQAKIRVKIANGEKLSFEDLNFFDLKSLQKILQKVTGETVVKALKSADSSFQGKIFSLLSERLCVVVKEQMEFTGPVKLADVKNAQVVFVEAAEQLIASKAIQI